MATLDKCKTIDTMPVEKETYFPSPEVKPEAGLMSFHCSSFHSSKCVELPLTGTAGEGDFS